MAGVNGIEHCSFDNSAAGALEGVGPAMVEDIFASAVVLEIAGQGADEAPVLRLEQHVMAEPAGLRSCRSRSSSDDRKACETKAGL